MTKTSILGSRLLMLTFLLLTLSVSALATNDYITFASADGKPFSLYRCSGKSWDGTLYYATNLMASDSWQEWNDNDFIDSSNDGKLYLRGENNTVITGADTFGGFVLYGNDNIACSGNIETLLDWGQVENGEHPDMGEYCYYELFAGCENLTSVPELPAETLTPSCYERMFFGCRRLISAPELRATALANGCYRQMFCGCEKLTSVPELPAKTLMPSCYAGMFHGCESLTSAPDLPATNLVGSCYTFMFLDCTQLTSVPNLKANTLANGCCYCMFLGCTGLYVSTEKPIGGEYTTWYFTTNGTEPVAWKSMMLYGIVDAPSIALDTTYYVSAINRDAVTFTYIPVEENGEKYIQLTFSGDVKQGTNTLTMKQSLSQLFGAKWNDLSGHITFGFTVVGMPDDVHVTEATLVSVY